jgi:hypothetical protein
MPKCKRPPIHDDPYVLTAVLEYRRTGLSPEDAMRRLRISRRTYYRCLKAIEDRRRAGGADGE